MPVLACHAHLAGAQIIAQKAMHRFFLDAGLLGTLKAWLELLPDRTLPNVKVCTQAPQRLACSASMPLVRTFLRVSLSHDIILVQTGAAGMAACAVTITSMSLRSLNGPEP